MTAAPAILAPVTVTTRVIEKRPAFVMPENRDWYHHKERVEPSNMAQQDLRPREDCDRCSHDFWRFKQELPDEMHEHYAATIAASVLKVVGEPCWKCGDASPKGTWAWNGPTRFRVSGDGKSHDGQRYSYIEVTP